MMIGRPRLSDDTKSRKSIGFRTTKEQAEALEAWARRHEMSVGGAIRKCISRTIGV
jgi:hypothetical protein